MCYNSQVGEFIVGDLVVFTGYEIENPPEAPKIGIVIEVGIESTRSRMYRVLWLHNKTKVSVSAKHLQLAYEIKE